MPIAFTADDFFFRKCIVKYMRTHDWQKLRLLQWNKVGRKFAKGCYLEFLPIIFIFGDFTNLHGFNKHKEKKISIYIFVSCL